jgi:hypothetical protein
VTIESTCSLDQVQLSFAHTATLRCKKMKLRGSARICWSVG